MARRKKKTIVVSMVDVDEVRTKVEEILNERLYLGERVCPGTKIIIDLGADIDDLAYIVTLINDWVMTAFNVNILVHPDGISIDNDTTIPDLTEQVVAKITSLLG